MEGSVSFIDGNVVNLYIIYTLDSRSRDLNTDFTLGNCLKLTMDNDLNIDITIIVLDSMHVHNFCRQTVAGVKILFFSEWTIVFLCMFITQEDILALGEGLTQGLVGTTITG